MTSVECFAAAHALAKEAERRYEIAVDELLAAKAKAEAARDKYSEMLDLAEQAARRLVASGDLPTTGAVSRVERAEHAAGIARIRAARLAREAPERMAA